MKKDLHGWLDANAIYPGISGDLAAAHERDELYVVTTKQVHHLECLEGAVATIMLTETPRKPCPMKSDVDLETCSCSTIIAGYTCYRHLLYHQVYFAMCTRKMGKGDKMGKLQLSTATKRVVRLPVMPNCERSWFDGSSVLHVCTRSAMSSFHEGQHE